MREAGDGGDFIRRDDSDRDDGDGDGDGDGDALGRNGGEEAIGILAQGSPIEADMGSVESESDISKVVKFSLPPWRGGGFMNGRRPRAVCVIRHSLFFLRGPWFGDAVAFTLGLHRENAVFEKGDE
ncbi:MAG: hypothetical protein ACJAVK_002207, partial [Akkermansiaceae bacterium]